MLRRTSNAFAIFAALFLGACQVTPMLHAEAWMSGRVVDVSGAPVAATITIGDEIIDTNDNGAFALTPALAPVYRVEFEADGYYPMRQTFSHAELERDARLGDIVLVERKPTRTLFVFGGDAMIGRRFYEPFAGEPVLVNPATRMADSQALLAEMKPYLERADYASINLETPIFEAPPGPAAPKSVTFWSAPETLDALEWAGVDYVALGNNHIYDFLEPGLDETFVQLADSGLDYSGGGHDEAGALQPHTAQLGGSAYDLLSFVGWPAGPPSQSAEAEKGGAALGTEKNLTQTVSESVGRGGIPIVQYHGGLEYVEEPTLTMETRLKRAIDAGAGLVIGHHPHVTQGLELYQGKLIAWSLGNFLFDQYFYSAQSAALVYVWMDGDAFHHAETVPVYIKGYHPTPAVGAMRNKINRRLFELSERRGTRLQLSGGHMILSLDQSSSAARPEFDVAMDCEGGSQRRGRDLIARGDFDSYWLFDAPDRSWLDMGPNLTVTAKPGAEWDQALFADIARGETVMTGMRKFQRVFTKGTPMSVRAQVSSSQPVEVRVILQTRADGQGLTDALDNGRRTELGRMRLNAGESATLDLDFDSPRTRTRSLRVLLEMTALETDAQVEIDALELIEWETPFSAENNDCPG